MARTAKDTTGCDKMEIEQIMELVDMVSNLDIEEISIETAEIKLSMTKGARAVVHTSAPTPPATPEEAQGFAKAVDYNAPAESTGEPMASSGQVKYAKDMVKKLFGIDHRAATDFFAHQLGMTMNEIPDIETWESTLTKDMAGLVLDAMEMAVKKGRMS